MMGMTPAEKLLKLAERYEWRDISTAPDSDGTYGSGGDYSAFVTDGEYELIATRRLLGSQHFWQYTDYDGHCRIEPTHWMPLPTGNAGEVIRILVEGLQKVELIASTAGGWEDGETFYKAATERSREIVEETLTRAAESLERK